MSAGPVGIGDRIGRTDREIVHAHLRRATGASATSTARSALVDACLFGEPARGERLAWATTTATRTARCGPTSSRSTPPPSVESSPTGWSSPTSASSDSRRCYDWRRRHGRARPTSIGVELAPRDWALWVCAPPGERADAGDLTKYVTVPSDLG